MVNQLNSQFNNIEVWLDWQQTLHPKNIDFNGLGSSNLHDEKKIYLTIGTPEKHASNNSLLAQDPDSIFGKILGELVVNKEIKHKRFNIDEFSIKRFSGSKMKDFWNTVAGSQNTL